MFGLEQEDLFIFLMMKFLFSLFLVSLVLSAPVIKECSMSGAQRQAYLDMHNKLRNRVATGVAGTETYLSKQNPQPSAQNMRALTWSPELEQWATNWAAKCPSGHRPNRVTTTGDYFGENIFWQWSTAQLSVQNFNVSAAVASWYNEVKDFQPTKISPFKAQGAGEPMTGHYTQVAWASVTQVGCGTSVCFDSASRFPWSINIVCNYNGGNLINSPMYKSGSPNCAANGLVANTQYSGLCGSIDSSKVSSTTSTTCPAEPSKTPATTTPTSTPTTTPTTTPKTTTTTTTTTTTGTIGTTFNGWTNEDPAKWVAKNSNHPAYVAITNYAKSIAVKYFGATTQLSAPYGIYTSAKSIKIANYWQKADGTNFYYSLTTASLSGTSWYASSISYCGIIKTNEQLFSQISGKV